MTVGWVIIGVYCLVVGNGDISFLFSKDEGILTLFFLFDWKNIPKNEFFGIKLPNLLHCFVNYAFSPTF